MFCAGSSPARGLSKICDDENLRKWFQVEIKFNACRHSAKTIHQLFRLINPLMPGGSKKVTHT